MVSTGFSDLNGCIQCSEVCVEFGNVLVLDEVSFSIPKGILTGVVGPNGGGKSTLFNVRNDFATIQESKCFILG